MLAVLEVILGGASGAANPGQLFSSDGGAPWEPVLILETRQSLSLARRTRLCANLDGDFYLCRADADNSSFALAFTSSMLTVATFSTRAGLLDLATQTQV